MPSNPIPESVIRRVQRVVARIDPEDALDADLLLDDIFVLCRAFEATWPSGGGESERAVSATTALIEQHGIAALPRTADLLRIAKLFIHAPAAEVAEWFEARDVSPEERKRSIVSTVKTLYEGATSGRWGSSDSRRLARFIYSMRCAVIHPRLDTTNVNATKLLPALRDALIELTIASASSQYSVELESARAAFAIN